MRALAELGPVVRRIPAFFLPFPVSLFPGFLGSVAFADVVLHEMGQSARFALPGFRIPGADGIRAGEPPGLIQQVLRIRRRQVALFLRRPAS